MDNAYCVKCRKRRSTTDDETVTTKNGKSATRGKCSSCGSTVYRLG